MSDLFGTESTAVALAAGRYAHIALEQGIDVSPTGLTYAVPESMADLGVGERVMVPLGRGNQKVAGYIVELVEDLAADGRKLDPSKVKPIASRDKSKLSLPADLVELGRWIASYYCAPLGMVYAAMLPAAVKKGTGSVFKTMVRLADAEPEAPAKLSKQQKAAVEAAKTAGEWVELRELADLAGAKSVAPVKGLIERGVLEVKQQEAVVSDLDLRAAQVAEPRQELVLNAGQAAALDHLVDKREGFGVHLLHGVTGSGKTEVYLRLIEKVLEQGEGAEGRAPGVIVLVPEIALTPQTVGRFFGRFSADDVAVLHSGLTQAQRHTQWRRLREGKARIVVGARSAVFAPLPNVRLIVVDEEHESSYKQDQLPRYHARDVAIKRAQLLGAPVLLGSATPSLESYANAVAKRYHLISLPERAPGMKLPHVDIVDMIAERRARRGVHLMSQRLEQEIRIALGPGGPGSPGSGGKVILLLNRRGYANYIACPDQRCGWMMGCESCDATMVYHKDQTLPAGGLVRCHHCLAEQLLPAVCPVCGKKTTVFGLGTQRVEEELIAKFPGIRSIRMDSDSMRTGRDYQESLDRFRKGEADVLLGTQMIAKGLDFPSVRLVGVISADTSLHMPDFRAGERTFQLIAQVAGRSGRSDQVGKVIVQTFSPEDPAINFAAEHDYEGFAQRELELRGSVGLPPVTRMARIVIRDKDLVACTERARKLADHLKAFNDDLGTQVRLRGPSPCPVARVADHHRLQIELIASDAGKIQKLITALRNTKLLISDTHTAVDVDPVALL